MYKVVHKYKGKAQNSKYRASEYINGKNKWNVEMHTLSGPMLRLAISVFFEFS